MAGLQIVLIVYKNISKNCIEPLCVDIKTTLLLVSRGKFYTNSTEKLRGGFHGHSMDTKPTLTLDVFLSTITIFFLIVSQLSLLVCLVLTYVTIIPIIIRQFRAMLRINRGFILIKESACEVGKGLIQE